MLQQSPSTQVLNNTQATPAGLVDNVLGLVRKNFLIILCTSLVGLILGVCYARVAPPTYIATAQILIDTRKVQVLKQQPIFGENPMDFAAVESQLQILKSKALALSVVKALNLANDPTFIEQSTGTVGWLLGLVLSQSRSTVQLSDSNRSEAAVAALLDNLKVTRAGSSYVLDINFRSRSPDRAAQMANAIAEAYVADQVDSKYQSLQMTSTWLRDRLGELREQRRIAERAVVDFKAQNNIAIANGKPIKEEELNQINGQLVKARAETSEAKARLDRIESVIQSDNPDIAEAATVSDSLSNPIITKLRDKYLDYANREADLAAKYGSSHFAVVNLRRQMRQLRGSILDELKRISETYKSDYAIAKQRQSDLEKALAGAVAQSQTASKSDGPLRELESSAESYRALYEGFLQRYVQSVHEQSSPTPEARLITSASPPQSTSGPKGILIVAFTSIGGLMFGAGIGLIRQSMDRVFRTKDQIEALLQTDCIAIVPVEKVANNKMPIRGLRTVKYEPGVINRRGVMWAVVSSPLSRFTESIRSIKFAVDANKHNQVNKGQVFGVTSSLPDEGKSTIAGSLALVAAHAKGRVILVDCDLRNPQLSRRLAPNAKYGLLEVLSGAKSINDAIFVDPDTKLEFLPTVLSRRLTQSSELLASDAVRKLFERLRECYDYVIVDLSPIAPIVDVRATVRFIDCYMLVVAWGSTNMNLVEHALKNANGIYEKLVGVVMNKTEISALGQYQGDLKHYYHNTNFVRYG